jgi:pimeloyl-ACP methyl ester carboxylesterase
LVSAEYVAAYARLVPNARVATIGQAGHSPHLEQPDDFTRVVLQFLEGN